MGSGELTKEAFLSRNKAQQADLETFMEWDFVILFWGPGNLYKIWAFAVAASLFVGETRPAQGSQATLSAPCCPFPNLQAQFFLLKPCSSV